MNNNLRTTHLHRSKTQRFLGGALAVMCSVIFAGCSHADHPSQESGKQSSEAAAHSPQSHTDDSIPIKPVDTSKGKKPVVVTTFTILSDIAQNVSKDHMEIVSITKPGAEIHGYEPTPGDIKTASKADLVIDNGFGLEIWFKKFVQEAKVPHIVATKGIDPINISEDASAGHPNPHAWMSPKLARTYVDNIVDAFSQLDPAHRADYVSNGDSYKKKLDDVLVSMQSELRQIPEKQRALVTCEGAFSYLARDAGLKEQYIWPVNAESQATPKQMASVKKFVKDNNVPAVFCESTVSDAPMQQIVSETGATFGGVLYVDSLSESGGPVPTYLDLIGHDAKVITNGLTGKTKK